jgi:F-type H+-transporting ATPase subunit epsilon
VAETLHLRILTPRRELVDETVEMVTAEGALGQFGVLPKHIAYLTALEPGALSYRKPGGAETRLAVKGGYAEVRDDEVTILADEAIPAEDLRAGTARAAIDEASKALEAAPYGHPEHERSLRELRWAEVRAALAAH